MDQTIGVTSCNEVFNEGENITNVGWQDETRF